MLYSHTSGSSGSITTRHFINHIVLCYSHKIHNIIIWLVLFKCLKIYSYGDTGMTEMDSAAISIYLGDPGVDRHHLITRNTHSIIPSCCSPCTLAELP